MAEIEWLLFLAQLPATPSSLRVNVWRRLREAGSASLQNGVWILPHSPENRIFLERLMAYVKQNEASGQIFAVQGANPAVHDDIVARFETERGQEYDELLEQCEEFIAEIEKETKKQKFTFAELEENEQNLQRLRKWITKIQKRDYFKTKKSQEAAAAFQNCQRILQSYTREVYKREGINAPIEADIASDDHDPSEQEEKDERE